MQDLDPKCRHFGILWRFGIIAQKSNRKSNPIFPILSDFFRFLDFSRLPDFPIPQLYSESLLFDKIYIIFSLTSVINAQHIVVNPDSHHRRQATIKTVHCSGSWWGPSQLQKGSTVGWWFVMFLMINSAVFVIGSSSPSWWGPSQSKQGTSSLFELGGALFRLPPICSWEELWFLVVLDTASLPPPSYT